MPRKLGQLGLVSVLAAGAVACSPAPSPAPPPTPVPATATAIPAPTAVPAPTATALPPAPTSAPPPTATPPPNAAPLRIVATIPVGKAPSFNSLVVAEGAVWVPNTGDGTISRVDPTTNQVVATIPVATTNKCRGDGCEAAVAPGDGGVWATANNDRTVVRIDPATNLVATSIAVEPLPFGLAVGDGAIWVTSFNNNAVVRIDPTTGQVAAMLSYPNPWGIAVGDGAVWVVLHGDNKLVKIDPQTNQEIASIQLREGSPSSSDLSGPLALGEGGLWATHVTNGGIKGAVTQVDPTSGQVLATIPLDKPPAGIAVGNGAVWVANEYGTLTRIDPRTHTLTTFQVDHPLQGVALADGVIWASTVAPDGLLRLALPPKRRNGSRNVGSSCLLSLFGQRGAH